MFLSKIIHELNDNTLKDILFVNRFSFPEDWHAEGAEAYYRIMLQLPDNIGILLKSNDRIVGFLMAIPQHAAIEELKEDDTGMKPDDERYYIETVEILPEYAGRGGFSLMLDRLLEASGKDHIKLSLHARVTNGFTQKVQKKLTVTSIRRIDRWKYYHFSEPTDYIEGMFGLPETKPDKI